MNKNLIILAGIMAGGAYFFNEWKKKANEDKAQSIAEGLGLTDQSALLASMANNAIAGMGTDIDVLLDIMPQLNTWDKLNNFGKVYLNAFGESFVTALREDTSDIEQRAVMNLIGFNDQLQPIAGQKAWYVGDRGERVKELTFDNKDQYRKARPINDILGNMKDLLIPAQNGLWVRSSEVFTN